MKGSLRILLAVGSTVIECVQKIVPRLVGTWLAASALALPACASEFQDFQYEVDGGEVVITGYVGSGGEVLFPASIEDLPVRRIGDVFFLFGANVTRTLIPKFVYYFNFSTLSNCGALAQIEVDSENANYSSHNGVLFNRSKSLLIRCPRAKTGDYIMPLSVESISNSAFEGCSALTGISISDRVTRISNYGFSGCSAVKWVDLPRNLVGIGTAAFGYCGELESVQLPQTVSSLGDAVFIGCVNLNSVSFSGDSPSIGSELGIGMYFSV